MPQNLIILNLDETLVFATEEPLARLSDFRVYEILLDAFVFS